MILTSYLPICQDLAHDPIKNVKAPQISTRNNPICRMALPPIQPESQGRPRLDGGAWRCNPPFVKQQVIERIKNMKLQNELASYTNVMFQSNHRRSVI